MFNLYKIEMKKIFKSKGFVYGCLSILLVVLILGMLMKSFLPDNPGENWESQLKVEQKEEGNNPQDKTQGIYFSDQVKHKDVYLEKGINPYEWNSWRFSNSLSQNGMDILISIVVIIITSSLITSEYHQNTMKNMVATPNRRMDIILSKFLGALTVIFILSIFYYIITIIVGSLFFGVGSPDYQLITQNSDGYFDTTNVFSSSILILLLRIIVVILVAAFTFTISLFSKNQALAVGLGTLFLFAGSMIGGLKILNDLTWYKLTPFPHMNLVNYVNAEVGQSIMGLTLPYSLLIISLYFIFFLLVTIIKFNKEDIL